ncbi:MAG: DUF192 domain-containing protein [Cyanophyceae cyanobacterium]
MRKVLSAIVVFGLLLGCSSQQAELAPAPVSEVREQGQMLPVSATVRLGNEQIELEVAQSPQQQAMGLMYREFLPPHRGMLFPFEELRLARFWMKNVRIPLDMVFLRDGEIQAIFADVPPCTTTPCPTYGPPMPVNQVIELPGGRAAELGLQAGDRVTIEFLAPE